MSSECVKSKHKEVSVLSSPPSLSGQEGSGVSRLPAEHRRPDAPGEGSRARAEARHPLGLSLGCPLLGVGGKALGREEAMLRGPALQGSQVGPKAWA